MGGFLAQYITPTTPSGKTSIQSIQSQLKVIMDQLENKMNQNRSGFYTKLIQTEFPNTKQKQGKTIAEILLMLFMPLLESLSIIDAVVRLFKYFALVFCIFLLLLFYTGGQIVSLFYFFKYVVLTVCFGGGVYFGGITIRGMRNYSGFTKNRYACVGFIGDGQTRHISKFQEKKIANELVLWRNTALDLCLFQLLSEFIDANIYAQENQLPLNVSNIVKNKNIGILSQQNRDAIMQFISGGKLRGNDIPHQWFYIDCNSYSSGWNRLRQRVELDQKFKIMGMIKEIQQRS